MREHYSSQCKISMQLVNLFCFVFSSPKLSLSFLQQSQGFTMDPTETSMVRQSI